MLCSAPASDAAPPGWPGRTMHYKGFVFTPRRHVIRNLHESSKYNSRHQRRRKKSPVCLLMVQGRQPELCNPSLDQLGVLCRQRYAC